VLPFIPGRHQSPLRRRALLLAGLGAAVNLALPRVAFAAPAAAFPAAADNRRFSVMYKGDRIGAHSVMSASAGGETRIDTEIDLLVKIASFTMFEFSHRSAEIWRDGRLISLRSDTLEDGESLHVEGGETQHGFRVVSDGGPFIAAAATLTSNGLWTPTVLEQATVVDAQHGGIIGISAHKFVDESIMIGGRPVHTTRYTFITPYLAGSIWYDQDDLWVRGEFEFEGSIIHYRLDV